MSDAPQILLAHHLETLKLPTFPREDDKRARRRRPTPSVLHSARSRARGAAEGMDHVPFLTRLVELELIDRERRMIEHRNKAAFAIGLEHMATQWLIPACADQNP